MHGDRRQHQQDAGDEQHRAGRVDVDIVARGDHAGRQPRPDREPDHPEAADLEREVDNRRRLDRTLAALAECPPTARRVFRLVYGAPRMSHADAAREAGISLQRVRQTLCETRQRLRAALAEENEA